jgi:hypothetical protein
VKLDLNKININILECMSCCFMSILNNCLFLELFNVAVPIKLGFWRLSNVEILIGTLGTLFCVAVFKNSM